MLGTTRFTFILTMMIPVICLSLLIGFPEVILPYVNWVSPSSVNGHIQVAQKNFISRSLVSGDSNMAVMLQPLYVYKKNTLWMQEHQIMKGLAERDIHVDKSFGLVFDKKPDTRDARPLMYPGCWLWKS